jgi:steroid delta-isomerase-like uncharacterized protein
MRATSHSRDGFAPNQALQQTAAAILFSRSSLSLSAAAAAELERQNAVSMRRVTTRSDCMVRSLASKIQAANSALIANGNLDAVGEFFTPDYVVHLTDQDMTGGHDAIRRFLGEIQRAFSHLQVDVEILVEAKDRVAWQRTLRGTHQGDFKGFPATGRPIVWRDMATSRFRDGLIAEDWVITDLAERLLLARKR